MRLAAVLLALALASPVQGRTVLDSMPMVRIDSAEKSTKRTVLAEADRAKARVSIVWLDGRYYWATREHRELVHRRSGSMHYFIEPDGGGYVKVLDTHHLSPTLRAPGPRYRFMEHVTLGMGTLTHFGAAETFTLDDE